ncbi:MAG TPA: molybdopterin-dependent oxidoreductase [Thermomicrobiales bacterium]|nr:molybdopterin-dependent oxidoreductase [Thermomicrobiales bacterium]
MAVVVGGVVLAAIVLLHVVATRVSLRSPRSVQRTLGAIVDPVQHALSHAVSSHQHYDPADISPYFRVNGRPPESRDYSDLERNGFTGWRLEVCGMVREPQSFSLDDLKAMPRRSSITNHHCIQGWSNIGEWEGVPVSHVLERCRPLPTAQYAVFRALDDKGETMPDIGGKGQYYEVVDLTLLRRSKAILAYEMNGEPLTSAHGAPLRLRLETQLGFKMVKFLAAIEVVEDYREIGEGMGAGVRTPSNTAARPESNIFQAISPCDWFTQRLTRLSYESPYHISGNPSICISLSALDEVARPGRRR